MNSIKLVVVILLMVGSLEGSPMSHLEKRVACKKCDDDSDNTPFGPYPNVVCGDDGESMYASEDCRKCLDKNKGPHQNKFEFNKAKKKCVPTAEYASVSLAEESACFDKCEAFAPDVACGDDGQSMYMNECTRMCEAKRPSQNNYKYNKETNKCEPAAHQDRNHLSTEGSHMSHSEKRVACKKCQEDVRNGPPGPYPNIVCGDDGESMFAGENCRKCNDNNKGPYQKKFEFCQEKNKCVQTANHASAIVKVAEEEAACFDKCVLTTDVVCGDDGASMYKNECIRMCEEKRPSQNKYKYNEEANKCELASSASGSRTNTQFLLAEIRNDV